MDSDDKPSKKAPAAEEEEPKKAARKKKEGTDDEDVNDTAKGEEEHAQQDDVEQEEEEEGGGRTGAQEVGAAQEGESSYSKIYVDEVQDLTQAEIALLFMLSKSRRFGGRPLFGARTRPS